ncbi:hypothetical protein CPB86DRAFT_754398 [Serendipita vermifera]|nr:hypothetical protein CPB86DRAFT_754398 [Serendipita vermifera]
MRRIFQRITSSAHRDREDNHNLSRKKAERRRSNLTATNLGVTSQAPIHILNLPYEVLETILTYAWHGDPTGLPGSGIFINFVNANPIVSMNITLSPNPHNRLTSSVQALGTGELGVFMGQRTFVRLSLVCSMWNEIMQNVVKTYVSLPSLRKFEAYSRLVRAGLPVDSPQQELTRKEDRRTSWKPSISSSSDSKRDSIRLDAFEAAQKARRLCRALHVHIPTGNLSMVPSWDMIPPLISQLPALTHLMLTASEAHPAIHHSLLQNLPPTIATLDIHISTPYKYQRPVLLHVKAGSKGETQIEGLRRGLCGVKSFLVNVLDVDLLGSLLEGFGTAYEPSPASSLLPETESSKGQGYSSPALQSLTLLGPHDLTDPNITRTVSHSPSIHTLKLYPRSSRGPVRTFINIDPFTPWNAVDALSNEAWFPALENLVVQLPQFEKTTPELDRIKAVCEKRGVRVRVEQAQGVTVL